MANNVWLLVTLGFVIGVCSAQQKIFVSIMGSDSAGCGAQNAPCGSIYGALAIASPGAVVYFYPGAYKLDPSQSPSITYNITFTAAVPQEGPVQFSFQNACLNPGVKYAFKVAGTTEAILVRFEHIEFSGLHCENTQESFPAYLFVESSVTLGGEYGVKLVMLEAELEDNEFYYTGTVQDQLASRETADLINAGLIVVYTDVGADQVVVDITNSLWSHNHAIGLASSGNVDLNIKLLGVYNTTYYEYPSIYALGAENVTLTESAFNGNEYNNPLASCIYVNASESLPCHVSLVGTVFKQNTGPAVKLQGSIALNVTGASFSYITNNAASGVDTLPLFVGDALAISFNEVGATTFLGSILVADSVFLSNGLGAGTQNFTSIIGAAGFSSLSVTDCQFEENNAVSIAVMGTQKNGLVFAQSNYFYNNSRAAILVSAAGEASHSTTINDSIFANNLVGEAVQGVIQFGGYETDFTGTNLDYVTGCNIVNSPVGIYVASATETVSLDSVETNSNQEDLICAGGEVTITSSTVNVISCSGNCQVTIDASPVPCQ